MRTLALVLAFIGIFMMIDGVYAHDLEREKLKTHILSGKLQRRNAERAWNSMPSLTGGRRGGGGGGGDGDPWTYAAGAGGRSVLDTQFSSTPDTEHIFSDAPWKYREYIPDIPRAGGDDDAEEEDEEEEGGGGGDADGDAGAGGGGGDAGAGAVVEGFSGLWRRSTDLASAPASAARIEARVGTKPKVKPKAKAKAKPWSRRRTNRKFSEAERRSVNMGGGAPAPAFMTTGPLRLAQ